MVKTRAGNNYNLIVQSPDINIDISSQLVINSEMADHIANSTGEPEAEVTNAQLQQSLKNLTHLVETNNASMSTVNGNIDSIQKDISHIKIVTDESQGIKEQLYSTQGKVARLEFKNEKLEEKLHSFESRTYEKDIMFYNIADNQDETQTELKETVYNLFGETMKIPQRDLFSRTNPAGEIRLDTVNRIGKFRGGNSRPVIASFVTKTGRNIAFSRKYVSNLSLDSGTVRAAEHYPAITKEKRQAQIPTLKLLKTSHTNDKVILAKDKILINGIPKNTDSFERNPLPSSSPYSICYNKVHHSEIITDKNSVFQAHFLPVHSVDQATAARNSIFQNPDLAKATHLMYAYKVGTQGVSMTSGFSDDNEIQGGSTLMNLLNTEIRTDVFLAVTRIKNGANIGPARFTHIKTCAQELLRKQELSDEPTFNHTIFK